MPALVSESRVSRLRRSMSPGTRAGPSSASISAASRVDPTCGDKPGHDDPVSHRPLPLVSVARRPAARRYALRRIQDLEVAVAMRCRDLRQEKTFVFRPDDSEGKPPPANDLATTCQLGELSVGAGNATPELRLAAINLSFFSCVLFFS